MSSIAVVSSDKFVNIVGEIYQTIEFKTKMIKNEMERMQGSSSPISPKKNQKANLDESNFGKALLNISPPK
jgi:hypothetical protein